MCHDCEAGTVLATSVKQEPLCGTTVKQELSSTRRCYRNCYMPRLVKQEPSYATTESNKCFRFDDGAGIVICHDCGAGTVLCHDCGTERLFATTGKREPLCATTVKREMLSPRRRSRSCSCHDCEAGAVFATTVKREPSCATTVKQDLFPTRRRRGNCYMPRL